MNQDIKRLWDCLIIGAGPAALAAAVYTSREDIQTALIEKGAVGGLAAITETVDNYPGFSKGVSGFELAQELQAQAERFGAKIILGEVISLARSKQGFKVRLSDQTRLEARSVLVASGSEWRKLGIPGEKEFYGRGIHNCATCDGAFYRNKRLVVIGGGNSAVQESLFLTKFASEINLLVRGTKLKASAVLIQEIKNHPKISIHFSTVSREIKGQDGKVKSVVAHKDGKELVFETDGVFVFIGLLPSSDFLQNTGVHLDDNGFVISDNQFMTSVEGVFCAGDVRSGATMQIASAVGEGASAALAIRHFLENRFK